MGSSGWTQAAFYSAQWLSVLGLYVLTALVLTLLRTSWQKVLVGRERRMASAIEASAADPTLDPSHRAVLVQGTRVCPVAEAMRLWRGTCGAEVLAVRMVRDTSALLPLVARCFEQTDAVRALEEQVATLQGMPCAMPNSNAARDMSDAQEEAYAKRLADAETKHAAACDRRDCNLTRAEEARSALDVPESDAGSSYFVLFASLVGAATARQTFQSAAVRDRVCAAPPPEEVNWAALQPAAATRALRRQVFAHFAFLAMLLYFAVPVAFVASLLALDQLEEDVPFLRTINRWMGQTVRSFLAAFLPSLALLLFLALLPWICAKLAAMHGDANVAQAQARTIELVWTFQFVWVLLGASVMSGLIAGNDAVGVATEYANNSTFFMIFLSLKAFFSTPFSGLARVPLIVIESAKKRLGLQAANVVLPEPLAYNNAWPQVLLSASVGVVYAAICPPILPFVVFHLGQLRARPTSDPSS